jgi:hypothetical protein
MTKCEWQEFIATAGPLKGKPYYYNVMTKKKFMGKTL